MAQSSFYDIINGADYSAPKVARQAKQIIQHQPTLNNAVQKHSLSIKNKTPDNLKNTFVGWAGAAIIGFMVYNLITNYWCLL